MRPRTLVVVDDRAAAGPPAPSTDHLILDLAWTPPPGEREDLVPARPIVEDILRRRNLFYESLDVLDAYAEGSDLAGRLMAGGVTWWPHARSFLSPGVHERLLWCHLLTELVRRTGYSDVAIHADRPALVDAAHALEVSPGGLSVRSAEGPGASQRPEAADRSPQPGVTLAARVRRLAGRMGRFGLRILRRVRGVPRAPAGPERRAALLEERIRTLATQPDRILAIVTAASFHTVRGDVSDRLVDPYVDPIVQQLTSQGASVGIVAIGLDHRRAADWAKCELDPRLIPMSLPNAGPGPDGSNEDHHGGGRLRDLPDIRLGDDGFDLGPAVRSMVADLEPWFARQRKMMEMAEAVIGELRPGALFTAWEGARTAWLGAARRRGVPSVAVQHGVVYHRSPDYVRPPHAGLVRPDLTCVFGPYERALLVEDGGYDAGSVIVTGSPRMDPDAARTPASPDERQTVRTELGVAPGDRLLVVSAGRRFIGDTVHGLSMVARLLGGPVPGVHVAIKLHPESRGDERYEALLTGLARAGGYAAPPLTHVRDIDVYRLLRAADAHLGLYSTVLTDAVLTDTPNMIAVGQAWADIIDYVEAGVATPVRTVDDLRAFMSDPKRARSEDRSRFIAAHYRSGDAIGRISTAILDVSRRAGA